MRPPTFFEGAEKKVEIAVEDGHPSLRSLGEAFWQRVVTAAEAKILSQRESAHMTAYLLSESSLFVCDSYATLITCGRTTLVDAVAEMLTTIDRDAIAMLVYERKNENFPHEQRTSFFDDARRLRKLIDGRAVRFGVEHEHAVRMFHTLRPHAPEADDRTLEVLMHGIDDRIAEPFRATRRPPTGSLAAELGLGRILDGYELDEFVFEPAGYSLNGMKGHAYATLHVTPERLGSYVSFETNDPEFGHDPSRWVHELVERFRPESFDVIAFEPDEAAVSVDAPGYVLRKHVQEPVCGYHVTFQHFYRPSARAARAFEIPL